MICFALRKQVHNFDSSSKKLNSKKLNQLYNNKISMKTQLNNSIQIGHYQIDFDTVLGKGATGYVYRGFDTIQRIQVAIKAIQMSNVNNEVTQYLLEAQKKALQAISSQFVVKCLDIIQDNYYCYIVTEECSNGTLRDYIKRKGNLSSNQALNCFRKIVHGYCAIIDSHIIHRDLKTANIMLKENGDPAIIDFGYAEMIMGKRPLIKYNVGSPSYMSPEAYLQSRYSEKSDVWALGVILYEMLTGKTLDEGKNIKKYFEQIENQKTALVNIDCAFSDLVCQVLAASLTVSVDQRATSHRLKYFLDLGLGPLGMPNTKIIGKQNSALSFPDYHNSQIPNGIKTPMRKQYSHKRNFSNTKLIFGNKTNFVFQGKGSSVKEPMYVNSFLRQPSLQLAAYRCPQRSYYHTESNIQNQAINGTLIIQKPFEMKLLYNQRVHGQIGNTKKAPLRILKNPRSSKQIHEEGKIFTTVRTVTSSKLI